MKSDASFCDVYYNIHVCSVLRKPQIYLFIFFKTCTVLLTCQRKVTATHSMSASLISKPIRMAGGKSTAGVRQDEEKEKTKSKPFHPQQKGHRSAGRSEPRIHVFSFALERRGCVANNELSCRFRSSYAPHSGMFSVSNTLVSVHLHTTWLSNTIHHFLETTTWLWVT